MNAFGYLLALTAALGMNHHTIEPALFANLDSLAALTSGISPGVDQAEATYIAGPQLDPNVLYAFG